MGAQVLAVLEQEEVPHCWAEQENWEVVEGAEGAEVHYLEAMVVVEAVVVQYTWVVVEVPVAQVPVQEGEEVGEELLLGEVAQEGEMRLSADLKRCLPQQEVVHGCPGYHWGERAGLKKRYSTSWVLFDYF